MEEYTQIPYEVHSQGGEEDVFTSPIHSMSSNHWQCQEQSQCTEPWCLAEAPSTFPAEIHEQPPPHKATIPTIMYQTPGMMRIIVQYLSMDRLKTISSPLGDQSIMSGYSHPSHRESCTPTEKPETWIHLQTMPRRYKEQKERI